MTTAKEQANIYNKTDKIVRKLIEPSGYQIPDISNISLESTTKQMRLVSKMKDTFLATLYMFKTRGGYDCEDFIKSALSKKTHNEFFDSIMSPNYHNPLRNIFHELYKINMKRPVNIRKVFIKLSMSFLICNPSGKFTSVIFVPKGEGQSSVTSIAVIRDIAYTISRLISIDNEPNIPINEVIIINEGKLSPDGINILSSISSKEIFVQLFNETDIMIPPISHIFTSKIEKMISGKHAIEEFLVKNRIFEPSNLRTISHKKDPVLKYMGIRPSVILKLKRPTIIPEDITEDSCYVITV